MSADRPLAGRLAVVTGGTRGIGAATSEALAALGATVVATYRSKAESANAFAQDVSARGSGQVHVAAYDLADPRSAGNLLHLASEHGDIDILVASASGPYRQAPLAEQSAEELAEKLSTDIAALHRLVIPITSGMRERGFGRVVVVGSLHALGPTAPGMASSGIAKAAEAAYVTFAVDELTGPGVTINLVEPGFIETDASAGLPPQVKSALDGLTPSARTGRPADVASAITWLATEESSFLNGVRIPVAGGLNQPLAISRVLSLTPRSGG